MKTQKQQLKTILAGILTGIALTAGSLAPHSVKATVDNGMPFSPGGYKGELNRKDTVNLLVRPIEGRVGSFMAVLFVLKNRTQLACAYVVDPTEMANQYTMTPLVTTPDGEIGFNNDNPSLMMSITNNSDPNDPEFTLINANGGNTTCIQGSARFKGKSSKYNWAAILPGRYKVPGIRDVGQMTESTIAIGDSSHEGTLTLGHPFKRPGTYSVREKAPGFFTMKLTGYTAEGRTEEALPTYIGFAAQTDWWDQSTLFLINPADFTDVLPLSSMDDGF